MNILTQFKNLLMESLRDNKKLIIGLYALFIIVFIIAWIYSSSHAADMISTMQAANDTASSVGLSSSLSPVDLFIHNEGGGIFTYIASIFFGIFAIIMVIYNAFNTGILGPIIGHFAPGGGLQYIIYLIPHGIFEITATVLQSVAGILLFMFIYKFIRAIIGKETQGLSESFEKAKKPLIQSLVIMVFAAILLLIAAPIEAYLSVPISELFFGV